MDLREFIKPFDSEIKAGDTIKFPVEMVVTSVENLSIVARVTNQFYCISKNDQDLHIKKKKEKLFQFLFKRKDGRLELTQGLMTQSEFLGRFPSDEYQLIQTFGVEE